MKTEQELRAAIDAAKQRAASARGVLAAIFDECPDGVMIMHADGSIEMNPSGARIGGVTQIEGDPDEWPDQYGIFHGDRVTRMSTEEMPLIKSLRTGQPVDDQLLYLCGPAKPEGVYMRASARPLPGGGAITVFRDVSAEMALEADIQERSNALAQRDAENRELIERLRVSLDDLSTPVLELWQDVLDVTIDLTRRLTSQPLSRKSTASQSSNSGCVGNSPCMPKSSLVRTMPVPKSHWSRTAAGRRSRSSARPSSGSPT